MASSIIAGREPPPPEIKDRLRKWHNNAGRLRKIHLSLGVITTIASVTVAARVLPADSFWMALVAWSAAITAGLLTSLNLETKSNHNRQAWRILNIAVERFQTEADFDIKRLNNEYEKGENAIGFFEVELL